MAMLIISHLVTSSEGGTKLNDVMHLATPYYSMNLCIPYHTPGSLIGWV